MKRGLLVIGAVLMIACGAPAAPAPAPVLLDPPAPIASSAPPVVVDAGAPAKHREPAATSDYEALLASLGHTDPDGARDRAAKHEALTKLRALADPRSADGLAMFATSAAPRWRVEAAFALAELGDVRAADHLAWRLEQASAKKLYPDPLDLPLTMDDHERIIAARRLGDLVALHPVEREMLKSKSERAVLSWLASIPAPHANGMRVLALVGSPKGIARLRTWAEPAIAIPQKGVAMFSPEFATAQGALRWLGRAQVNAPKRDEAVWNLLVKQLGRRAANVDASMDAALTEGSAVRAMALRALAVGALHGLAEWGDPKAFDLVVAHIEEAKNNEGSRAEGCAALAWVGDDRALARLVDKIASPSVPELVRTCYLQTLAEHPVLGVDAKLGPFVHAGMGGGAALGRAGFGAATAGDLVTWLDEPSARKNAAIALFFGGTREQAETAFAKVEAGGGLDDVKIDYVQAVGRVTDRGYESGAVARWAENAAARPWATQILGRSLGETVSGPPHVLTRELLRFRALADARSADEPKRTGAIAILQAMGERGALASLGEPLVP